MYCKKTALQRGFFCVSVRAVFSTVFMFRLAGDRKAPGKGMALLGCVINDFNMGQ